MAAKRIPKSQRKPAVVNTGTPATSYNDVVDELYEIDALLNGADSIVRDILTTGTGPADNLEYDALNAHKLLREAIRRIVPLADMIAEYGHTKSLPPEAANG